MIDEKSPLFLSKADEAKSPPIDRKKKYPPLDFRLLFLCETRFSLFLAGKKQLKFAFFVLFFVVVKCNVFSICTKIRTPVVRDTKKRYIYTLSSGYARDVRAAEIIRCPPPFILRRFALSLLLFGRLHRVFRFRATKRDFFTIVSKRFVAKSAVFQVFQVFQPVVLFDLEKTEGENTPVRGASVREESETIFVLSGVLLRVVVQKSPLGNVDSGASAIVSRLRDCVSTWVLRLV